MRVMGRKNGGTLVLIGIGRLPRKGDLQGNIKVELTLGS